MKRDFFTLCLLLCSNMMFAFGNGAPIAPVKTSGLPVETVKRTMPDVPSQKSDVPIAAVQDNFDVILEWQPIEDDEQGEIIGYDITRNGLTIAYGHPETSYVDKHLVSTNGTGNYTYCVAAFYETWATSETVCIDIEVTEVIILSGLNTGFEDGDLPEGWMYNMLREYNPAWDFSNAYWLYQMFTGWPTPFSMDDTYTYFLASMYLPEEEAYLMTSYIMPSEENCILLFDIEEMIVSPDFMGDGPELYVDISTDYGDSWILGTENLLFQLPGHPNEADYGTVMKDISPYIGEVIRIRFRGISDHGGINVFMDNVRTTFAAAQPDLSVQADMPYPTKVPYKHALLYPADATVLNNGTPIGAGEGKMEVSITPGNYSKTFDLPALDMLEKTVVSVDEPYQAAHLGTHTITYTTQVENDFNTENDSDQIMVEVTNDLFSGDTGWVPDGVGSTQERIILGTIYTLLEKDIVNAFSIAFVNNEEMNFYVNIWSLDENNIISNEPLYTSGLLQKGPITVIESYGTLYEAVMTDYPIEPQELEAGKYLFTVEQTNYTNIGLAFDSNPKGLLYRVDSDTKTAEAISGFGVPVLRIKTVSGNYQTFTITASAGVGGSINPAGEIEVISGDSQNFVITPDAEFVIDQILVDGENQPNAVSVGSYTFDSVVENHTITVSFERKSGIDDAETPHFTLYPNPTKGTLKIKNEKLKIKNIRVFDMMGRLMQEMANIDNPDITLDISHFTDGVYFLHIDGKTVRVVKQ